MGTLELFLVAVSLSMDAFAVSICKGLALGRVRPRHCAAAGLWFGGFQAAMPLLGYLLAFGFRERIEALDHWVAFILLAAIGGGMIKESFGEQEPGCDPNLGPKVMLPLALATSVDAMAVGISFAFLKVPILPAAALIGVTTFAFSAAGVALGSRVGEKKRRAASLCGGAVLVLLGVKILLEVVGVL